MTRAAVASPDAPAAIGPYSAALCAGGFVFVSGQIPLDPSTGALVEGDVVAQTAQVLRNISALLAAAGCTCGDVVKTTIYLADINDFAAVNETYRAWFQEPYPARATVEVARLPRDARVEIEAMALSPGQR